MADIQQIIQQLPIGDIARRLGVDEATADAAVRQAMPTLVGGLAANAQDPAGKASLERAVAQHSPALVEGGVALDDVDTGDGEKIVSHIFGGNRGEVTTLLGDQPGVDKGLVEKLLPILAPIVLSLIAQRMSGGGGQQQGGGLADVLGGLLGSSGGAPQGQGGLGDLLGSVLGGGQQQGRPGGGLGGLLGGLLGGGRR